MKLFYKIILSIILSVFILLLLEKFAQNGLKNNKNFKISYVRKHSINADLIVAGPCESEWVIDPDIIEKYLPYKIYNLSEVHSDFADNYLFIYEYLQNQAKPKAVVLYITPAMFDSSAANGFNTYRFTHLLNDSIVKRIVAERDPIYARHLKIPFLKYSYYSNFTFYKMFSGYINLMRKDTISQWPTGYVAPSFSYQHPINKLSDIDLKAQVFFWSESREKYFKKIIELLQKENIKVLLYESPIYYQGVILHKNRERFLNKIDNICKYYGVPYIRFDTLSMQYDKENYFTIYNTTLKGNALFNSIFGKILRDTLPCILNSKQ